jgi:hypothetical protein
VEVAAAAALAEERMTQTPANQPTEFQRFEALAKRILTTPKAELMKHAPKSKSGKLAGKKKRGK